MARFWNRNKVVNAFQPVDINSNAITGDFVSMKNYPLLTIILSAGVVGAATTITVEKATKVDGSGNTAITFDYTRDIDTTSGDAMAVGTATAALSSGTDDNQQTVIEVRAEDLGNYDCVNVNLSDPGSTSIWSGTYILSGGRYQNDVPPSAIID